MNHPSTASRPLILASKSPRRQALLRQAGLSFTVVPSTIDETAVSEDCPHDYVRKTAMAKAAQVAGRYPDSWIIGADTTIVQGDHVFGKPGDEKEARRMLRQLSDRAHTVLTGYCIYCKNQGGFFSGVSRTEVEFRYIGAAETDWYIGTGEPFDKAGGYAIQGLGGTLVKRIVGSYTNVVGLPLCEVVACLMEHGAIRRD